jgi:hypothetical protein
MNNAARYASTFTGLAAAVFLSGCFGSGSDDAPPPVTQPGGQSSPFVFDPTPSDSPLYVRVDRTGAPAVATALLSKATTVTVTGVGGGVLNPATAANNFNDQRDQFNRGDPVNDARDFAGVLVAGPQSNSLRNIHFKIANELRSLGLTPCSTTPNAATAAEVNVDTCVAQAAPVIVPDVITFDFAAPQGFPNGRTYDDPVADRLLAAALLKISPTGATPAPHTLNALVGVIDTWNGPVGAACPSPCQFTGDETNAVSPASFPFLRPAYP